MRGILVPFSHVETALSETPAMAANSFCDKLCCKRRFLILCPIDKMNTSMIKEYTKSSIMAIINMETLLKIVDNLPIVEYIISK